MNWLLADAKNRFSELVTLALTEGPQRVRRRNQVVVVLAESEYERLMGTRHSFRDYLLTGPSFGDLDTTRSQDEIRDVSL